jgi:hypothetical protein
LVKPATNRLAGTGSGSIIRKIQEEAAFLLSAMAGDVPVKITALALGLAVLVIIGIYAVAAWQGGSEFADTVARNIGLSQDGSISEVANYGLAFTASVLLFLASVENRSRMLLFLSVLMAYAWVDDASSYHERFGLFLAEEYNVPAFLGLRQQDTGEVIAWLLAASVLGLLLVFSLYRPRPGDLGALALVSAGFGLLILCGIVVDLIHIIVPPHLDLVFSIIEDGGEMVAMAYIAGVALGLSRNGRSYYEALATRAKAGAAKPVRA